MLHSNYSAPETQAGAPEQLGLQTRTFSLPASFGDSPVLSVSAHAAQQRFSGGFLALPEVWADSQYSPQQAQVTPLVKTETTSQMPSFNEMQHMARFSEGLRAHWSGDYRNNSTMSSPASQPRSPFLEAKHDSDDDKQPMDYKTMVMLALQSSSVKEGMTICQIYDFIIKNFAYYRTNKAPPTWRSRVRNVLTVNDCFRRIPDPKGGRKGTWLLTNRGKETFQSTVKSPLQVHKDARSTHIRRAVSQELRISDAVQVQPAESIQPCFQTHSRVQQPQSAAITFSNSVATPVDVDMAGLSDEEQVTRRGSLASLKSLLFSRRSSSPLQADSLLSTIVGRPLSAESMELVEHLASELKRECSMAHQQMQLTL